jgi:glucan biosynthesis protein C
MVQQAIVGEPTQSARRFEMDWLRVLAFGMLILYHIGMYYVSDWGWHIKSQHQSEWLQNVMLWSGQWRMSLLFLISGSAVAFLLPKMSLSRFYWSRQTRLLLPLLFGMAVVVVPQVYAEMAGQGRLAGVGYWQFWGAYLDQDSLLFTHNKTIGGWHVTWNHLWFLMYIYVYSLVAWAAALIFHLLKLSAAWPRMDNGAARVLLIVVLPVILLSLNSQLLYEKYPPSNDLVSDFYNHGRYFLAFVIGVILVRVPGCWGVIRQWRKPLLATAIASYTCVLLLFHGGDLGGGFFAEIVSRLVWSGNSWLWILAICGWAQQLLARDNGVIRYLNGGVYCYYILHQTVIIALAYHLAPYGLGPVLEPLCLIAGTTVLCLGGYEVFKRVPGLRLAFGITVSQKAQPALPKVVTTASLAVE